MLQRDKREVKNQYQELIPCDQQPLHRSRLCENTRTVRCKEEGREKRRRRGWERSRASSPSSPRARPGRTRVRQFVAQFPKSDDITAARTAVGDGREGRGGGGEARRGAGTTNLQNHLHVVAVALGLLRALEARAVVQQGLGDTRLFRVRGRRWHHVDLHRHSRTALPRACVQRDVQSLSATTAAAATATATTTTAATMTTAAGVTTRDAAPRISRWGDRVAMTAGNPRGYGRFYAPSLEPRPPSGRSGRASRSSRGTTALLAISRATGSPKGRDVASSPSRPFTLVARNDYAGDSSEGPKFPRSRRRAPETSRRKLRTGTWRPFEFERTLLNSS